MSNGSKNDAFLASRGKLCRGIRQNYPTRRVFSDFRLFSHRFRKLSRKQIFDIPFSPFFRTFVPQMAQISADGFLPLFAGRCPTLNATRPLALDGFCAADGADKRGWVLTSHSLPLAVGRCPTLNATRPLALGGFCAADGADKRGWVLTTHSLPLAVGRCPTLNATRPLALGGEGRKIFRLCIQVRPCTFNFQFSTLH